MQELRDIKDIVEVGDNSLMILLGLIFLGIAILSAAFYFYKNRRRRRKKPTRKELALEKLRNIDYGDPKDAVYTFEEKARYFLDEKNQKQYNNIIKEFEIYKYKKEVPALSQSIKKMIQDFIKELK